MKVEMARLNLSRRSKKLEKGRKSSAIKNEKNSGAKMVLPIKAKYPNAKALISTKVSCTRNGSLISFITQRNKKNGGLPASYFTFFGGRGIEVA